MTTEERLASMSQEDREWEEFFLHCEQYVDSCHRAGFPHHAMRVVDSLAQTIPHPKIHLLRAVTLAICGHHREAIDLMEATVANHPELLVNPGYVEYNIGLWRLTLGDYSAWGQYEKGHLVKVRPFRVGAPTWEGQELGPDSVLCIWGEQGAGDVFMFLRFIEDAARRSKAQIVLEVDYALTDILRSSPIVQRVGAVVSLLEAESSAIPHDVQVSIVSLPYRLGYTDEKPLRFREPYMAARPEWSAKAAEILRNAYGLSDAKPKVGFAWAGSSAHANNARRSIGLDAMAPLLAMSDVQWVNLQKNESCPGVAADIGPTLDYWSQTAAFLTNLDLVVSCDTALVHLAGAMGLPVMVMVPWAPCWRWGTEGDTTLWYKRTTLYRQPKPGDWATVVENVALGIEQFAAARRGQRERASI